MGVLEKLKNKDLAGEYYENAYANGYMDDWPAWKKNRVRRLIHDLDLPEKGKALEFGCGNGVFTQVIKQALPSWEVYGGDISPTAIENASRRYPECSFFVFDQNEDIRFDFIFSHHVLEHVYDIQKVMEELVKLSAIGASMLHILPCGNEGSLAYRLCVIREGGIEYQKENRFFYEVEGHLRRLNTLRMNRLMNRVGFTLNKGWYSMHYWGQIRYFSRFHPQLTMEITNPKGVEGFGNKAWMWMVRLQILILYTLQFPTKVYLLVNSFKKKKIRHRLFLLFGTFPLMISYPFYFLVDRLAEGEWEHNKQKENGGEMYLHYHC